MGQCSTWKETCAVSVFVRLNAVWHQIAFSVEENYKAAILSIFSRVFGQQLWSNAPRFGQNQKPQPENPGSSFLNLLIQEKQIYGPEEKIPPAPGTNQIAGFVEFRPWAEKNINIDTNLSVSPKNLIESLNPLANGLL